MRHNIVRTEIFLDEMAKISFQKLTKLHIKRTYSRFSFFNIPLVPEIHVFVQFSNESLHISARKSGQAGKIVFGRRLLRISAWNTECPD
jgi:hypothetical protein